MSLSCSFGHKDHELFAQSHGLARRAAPGLPSSCGCFLSHSVWIGSSSHSRCCQSFCPRALARAIAWCVCGLGASLPHRSARVGPQVSTASSRPPVPQAWVEIKRSYLPACSAKSSLSSLTRRRWHRDLILTSSFLGLGGVHKERNTKGEA